MRHWLTFVVNIASFLIEPNIFILDLLIFLQNRRWIYFFLFCPSPWASDIIGGPKRPSRRAEWNSARQSVLIKSIYAARTCAIPHEAPSNLTCAFSSSSFPSRQRASSAHCNYLVSDGNLPPAAATLCSLPSDFSFSAACHQSFLSLAKRRSGLES